MLKILISMFVLLSTSFSAQNDSYIFEAKGKFAKELKLLVERYSKEGKIDVKIIKTSNNKTPISSLSESENGVNISIGKKIYINNCSKCHGINAQKSSYANARVLSTLSKEELIDQMTFYRRDINYGGSTRFVMYNSIDDVSADDLESIAQYIVDINNKETKTGITKSTKNYQDNNKEQSSYLK